MDLDTLLTTIGAFFTQAISWLGDILNVIVENPVLLIVVFAMPISGFAFGLLSRLKRI